jgi:hypothetical protein
VAVENIEVNTEDLQMRNRNWNLWRPPKIKIFEKNDDLHYTDKACYIEALCVRNIKKTVMSYLTKVLWTVSSQP